MICVYQIRNLVNGRVYVGSTKVFERRKSCHIERLLKNKHHSYKLQNAWNGYGSEVFVFEVLEECEVSVLCQVEQKWIDDLDSFTNGYNCRPTAESNRGYKPSEETKLKLSIAGKGRIVSESTREKMSSANRRRGGHSEETKARISASHCGKVASEEAKAKMRGRISAFKGRVHSEASKQLIKEARAKQVITQEHSEKVGRSNTGKKRTEEQKKRISDSLKGHTLSEETKKKISETKKRKAS